MSLCDINNGPPDEYCDLCGKTIGFTCECVECSQCGEWTRHYDENEACENCQETIPTEEQPVIKPTVGRIVWFHDEACQAPAPLARISGQPLAAIVTGVWSDRMVNLAVFDANGVSHPRTSITLVQDGDVTPPFGSSLYCEWMPYQKAQAENQASLSPTA